ncbi:MAG: NADH:flavin oxidoreductase/NADH oxidase [Chthoniobacteraceae bacterium]
MPDLFQPLTVRSVTLRNRIGVSPMCMYWSDDGLMSDWHLVHLGSRAIGGAALIIAEATAVSPEGRISPRDAGIWSDAHIPPLERCTRFMKEYGAVPGIQIAHSGRKGATAPPYVKDAPQGTLPPEQGGWQPMGPSTAPFYPEDPAPRELTVEEIRTIQEQFRAATARANAAGFDWVEFHSAHGYLAHSFLSPLSNFRTDEYGGSFENRMRFTVETARIMRREWPEEKPMSVRLSVSDWKEGGWTPEDSVKLSLLLKAEGVDVIACSSGAAAPGVKYPAGPGWQVPLSEKVREGAEIQTAAVGLITEPAQADEIIRQERADIVLLGREMLRDPYWPFHAAVALDRRSELKLPAPYDYAV